jgi:hypothetical protein
VNIEEQVELLMQGTEYGDAELTKAMAADLRQRLMDVEKAAMIRPRPTCTSGIRSPCGNYASFKTLVMR